ncbi:unnamed protein product [Dracunculus medinensis]|uniref:GOLGA2L5 domain-containing protein n=1 Tax=Dracunculus medinensis TaxID=318479 RepID=A0A0N4UHF6_DRAME|nr:unnamed protein product [Dracunculus medinensis]
MGISAENVRHQVDLDAKLGDLQDQLLILQQRLKKESTADATDDTQYSPAIFSIYKTAVNGYSLPEQSAEVTI